tara:strand:+ start:2390 stop:3511 length:1122 start_codon:yes stop_codon:yes gene_type:complete
MPSTYTVNTGIELIDNGDQSGTWGDTTNTNWDIADRAVNGVGTIDLSSSGAAHTLSTTDGTLSDGMYRVLVLSGATEACTITISPSDADKFYIVDNNTSYSCTFTQGSGGNVTVLSGDTALIYADGGGASAAVVDVTVTLPVLQASSNLSDVTNASTSRTNLGVAIGADVQAYDAGLQSISGLTTAADKMIYATASDTYAVTDLSAFARTILDDADGAAVVATLGITASVAELNYNDITTLGTSEASKVVTADSSGDVNLSEELKAKSYNETVDALSGTTPTVNCESGNVFTLTTSGATTFTFSNPPTTGTAYAFVLKVVGGGTYALTWPAAVQWQGGTTPDYPLSGETYVYGFLTHDGGTTWYGFLGGADFS